MTDRFYATNDYDGMTREFVDFDAYDGKGRRIGCKISRHVVTYTNEKRLEYQGWVSDKWLGAGYAARVFATRNGVEYGASHGAGVFRTEAEREAYVAKRVADSRKRAARIGAEKAR